jgi:16S rRNA (cytosine1407-C5)-methyltransferase
MSDLTTNSHNNLPQEFLQKLTQMFPDENQLHNILQTFHQRPVTIRLNTLQNPPQETLNSLQEQGFEFTQATFSDLAFKLENKSYKELTQTKEYKQGSIYLQSFASQLPVLALDPQPGQIALDLTAAPGSKTSQIAAITNQTGQLHANDVNTIRIQKLKHNLQKLGLNQANYLHIHNKHGGDLCQEFPKNHFDRILLDAPCSGEARFDNQNPKSYHYWQNHRSPEFHERQLKLLLAAWPNLKPGGTLVYSTCTFDIQENELVIHKLIQKFPDQVEVLPIKLEGVQQIPSFLNFQNQPLDPKIKNTFRIQPTQDIESFFIAKLQKR